MQSAQLFSGVRQLLLSSVESFLHFHWAVRDCMVSPQDKPKAALTDFFRAMVERTYVSMGSQLFDLFIQRCYLTIQEGNFLLSEHELVRVVIGLHSQVGHSRTSRER